MTGSDPAAAPRRDSPSVLIVRLGSLGDVVHAIPAAAALRRRYPRARIDWMVDPRYTDLLRLVRGVNRAIPIDPRGSRLQLFSTFRTIWGTGYDMAVDLQGLVKSALLARIAVPRRVLGFPGGHLREPAARALYTDTRNPGDAPHVIYKNLMLLRALDVQDAQVVFPITVPETAAVDLVLRRHGAGGYALLNPGAAWPNKRWPPDRFGALAAAIRDRWKLPSVVLWGPGERPLANAVVSASHGAAEAAPATTIPELVGLARHAALVVSGDTGPLHIAAAVAAPIVALFGPTDPARNGPWHPSDITLSRYTECACHYARRCRRAAPCIDDIALDDVVSAIERRIGVHG